MKKSSIVFALCVLVTVPMVLLTLSIKENKAEQQAINAVPTIKEGETRSSEWGKYYPRQYDTYMQTRKSDEISRCAEAGSRSRCHVGRLSFLQGLQ